jgi:16S rRNA U1498 N3-methylase RsmE
VDIPRYELYGDTMKLKRSPRKTQPADFKHQRAFFSKKDDLVSHLNEVRRIRNNKKIQLKDLKIEVTDDNKRQIELDVSI